jgi:hypothetical protein
MWRPKTLMRKRLQKPWLSCDHPSSSKLATATIHDIEKDRLMWYNTVMYSTTSNSCGQSHQIWMSKRRCNKFGTRSTGWGQCREWLATKHSWDFGSDKKRHRMDEDLVTHHPVAPRPPPRRLGSRIELDTSDVLCCHGRASSADERIHLGTINL